MPSRDTLRAWLVSRGTVLVAMAFAGWLTTRYGWGHPHLRPGASGFFAWDADWYRDLAAHGLDDGEGLRFFPLVAVPAMPFALLGAVPAGVALVAFVNACALAYAEGVARLTRWELGDERAARLAPWLVLLNPAAFVLVIPYAEALAGLLAVWCLWSLRRAAWGAAALAAYLGGLTRPVGLLLALPALVAVWRAGGSRVSRALAVAAAPLGCATYLAVVWAVRGDPLLPFEVQQRSDLRSETLTLPGEALGRAWHAMLGSGRVTDALHLFWVPVVLVLLWLVWRRLPAVYGAYATPLVLVALGTPRLASFERYSLAAFPLIMVAAASRPRSVRLVTWIVCCCALAGYSVLAFAHRYVP